MSILQLVADSNTKALDFLALAKYQDARRVWNESLRLTRGFLQDHTGKDDQTVISNPASGFLVESTLAAPESLVERLSASNNGVGVFAVFLKNFSFQARSLDGEEEESNFIDQATAVVLFNIALSHHCEAMQNPTECSNEIATALRLYQLAMALLTKSMNLQEETTGALMLAILNNMGHIFEAFLVDSMRARQCLESMEDVFFALPPRGGGLGVDEAFFYRYNTIFLFRKWRVAAAA